MVSQPVPPDGRGLGHVEWDALFRARQRVVGITGRLQRKVTGGEAAQPVMRDPNRLERSHPTRRHGRGFIFSRIAFGFKFMFSPVSVKAEVK